MTTMSRVSEKDLPVDMIATAMHRRGDYHPAVVLSMVHSLGISEEIFVYVNTMNNTSRNKSSQRCFIFYV